MRQIYAFEFPSKQDVSFVRSFAACGAVTNCEASRVGSSLALCSLLSVCVCESFYLMTEKDGACSTCGAYRFWWVNLRARSHLET
jgi:hypothetical protein